MPATPYIQPVRVIAVLGSVLFAYLAVIPGALVGATLNPACESSCGYAPAITVYLVIALGLSSLALVGSAVTLALFASRPSARTGMLVRRSLQITAAAIGALLFSEFALVYPVAAAVAAGVSIPGAWLITRGQPPRPGATRGP
jgi:hypothetical protein